MHIAFEPTCTYIHDIMHNIIVHVDLCLCALSASHDDGDIRISLLEAKKTNSASSNGLGDMSIHNDAVANRNSYAGFRGGYDNGMGDERNDFVPDLIR